jgi:hypothetical protein
MADEPPLTTITTSDRCPACGIQEIAPRDGPPVESVQVCSCLGCGFAFYRYRRPDDDARTDGRQWRTPPIGGGAPAPAPWGLVHRRPADFVDALLGFGIDVVREARYTRQRSRALREARHARRAVTVPGGGLSRGPAPAAPPCASRAAAPSWPR